MIENNTLDFIMTTEQSSIIKVIGVGGGGSNAVNHMYRNGIKDVTFVICNTDNQALINSPIEKKIQLGPTITNGLGAGNNPKIAETAANESLADIQDLLSQNTKMVFITAGMGGGTGTGAAPVIAKVAKEMNILTVGIVTIPFAFEGPKKIVQALDGVQKMSENVDALLVINNERLREIYPEFDLSNAFAKADDVLKDAAKGIAEIITIHGHINVDFADVNTIMRNGGVAIMNTGYASGENRLKKAINNALSSPLLKNNNVKGAKKILMNFYCSKENAIKVDEITQINEFMELVGNEVEEVIWGICYDEYIEDEVKITLIATGFGVNDVPGFANRKIEEKEEPKKKDISNEEETDTETEEISKEIPTDLFEKYYGDTKLGQEKKADTYINLSEQMDNEDVVMDLEKVAAFKRNQPSGNGPKPYVPKNLK